jgi:hypothetical protein
MAAQTVKAFLKDCYRLITSGTPTVPLHGDDESKAFQYTNELLSFYSGTALLTTIAKLVQIPLQRHVAFVIFVPPGTVLPTIIPDNTVYYTGGRLSNLENAWINLDGLDYPLFDESRNVFFDSYKYFPLAGLPRYCIITNQVDQTTMQIYPKPSQFYELFVYGKFELPLLNINGTMAGIPSYQIRFFRLAVAKDLSLYKSRSAAWTPQLEDAYTDAKDVMESVSAINLAIQSDDDSYLNGHWRVQAGI